MTMMEMKITDGAILILEIYVVFLLAVAIVKAYECYNNREMRKTNRRIQHSRMQHAKEVESAGRRMMRSDNNARILREDIDAKPSKKQNIKYTGIFSGEEVTKCMK